MRNNLLRRSVDPSIPWEKIDSELWLMFMQSLNQPHPYSGPIIFPHNKCFNYNFKGVCDTPDCQYTDKCIMYSERHPQFPVPSLCFKQKLNKSTNHIQFHFPGQNQSPERYLHQCLPPASKQLHCQGK